MVNDIVFIHDRNPPTVTQIWHVRYIYNSKKQEILGIPITEKNIPSKFKIKLYIAMNIFSHRLVKTVFLVKKELDKCTNNFTKIIRPIEKFHKF